MTREQIEWLLLTASAAPIKSVQEARHKANSMLWLSDQLDPPKQDEPPAGNTADPV